MNQELIGKLKDNNESLTELDLCRNKIDNIDVLEVLKYNSTLTYLSLPGNQIKNIDVFKVLKENNTLNYLYLDNKLIENNQILFEDILKYNFSLIEL